MSYDRFAPALARSWGMRSGAPGWAAEDFKRRPGRAEAISGQQDRDGLVDGAQLSGSDGTLCLSLDRIAPSGFAMRELTTRDHMGGSNGQVERDCLNDC